MNDEIPAPPATEAPAAPKPPTVEELQAELDQTKAALAKAQERPPHIFAR